MDTISANQPGHHNLDRYEKIALSAPIAILLLWLFSRLFSGLFDRLRSRRAPVVAAGPNAGYDNAAPGGYNAAGANVGGANAVPVVVGAGRRSGFGDHAHQTTKALRDLFIWVFSAWVLIYLVHGFTRELVIVLMTVAVLGLVWALLKKPLHKIADLLLIPLAILLAFLFIYPIAHNHNSTE